jgi:hypothetical protein
MAIFHLSVKVFSRSKGHSAVAAAAYRTGSRLVDSRTGEIADYTRRAGVLSSSLHLPDSAPRLSRAELWDQAEAAEKRKNSTVARECELSLPHELTRQAQIGLADQMARWLVDRYGVAVDCAVHEPTGENDRRNVHAHLLMTTRVLGPAGLGEKTRVLDAAATGSAEISAWRERWAELVNFTLQQAGHDLVDHRSHADRGLDQKPTIKEGRGRGAAERQAYNAEIRSLNDDLADALAERAHAAALAKVQEAEAYARRVTAWREQTQLQLAFATTNLEHLPTAEDQRRARKQLKVAEEEKKRAQAQLQTARRQATSSRWWNPMSMYRAWIAHRDMHRIEHRAGSLAHAFEQIHAVATSTHTREQVAAEIQRLRQQLEQHQVPVVPALPPPPVLRRDQREAQVEPPEEDYPPPVDEQANERPSERPRGLN